MQTLKSTEVKSIEQFFQLKQENLLKIMDKYLNTKYETVYSTKDYIIAIGDIPVALVAHLDTVFTTPPENIFYDRVKNVMWSPDGLGADDRAGVYAIIQLIKRGLKPTIIFTTDEEKGALGASALIKEHPKAVTDLKYIIELDRHGSTDCVFYECENPKFEKYVEDFGFVTAYGTFSDISVICPAWKIAGVNLSIGYVDEHSYSELLYIGNMLATISKVEKMLKSVSSDMETFQYIPSTYKRFRCTSTQDFDWNPSYGVSKNLWQLWHADEQTLSCSFCGATDFEYNLFPVKTAEGSTIYVCPDCVSDSEQINWCIYCGEAFMINPLDNPNNQLYCYDCEEREMLYGEN